MVVAAVVAVIIVLVLVCICVRALDLVLVLLWSAVVELKPTDVPTIVEVVVEEKKGLAENPTSRS